MKRKLTYKLYRNTKTKAANITLALIMAVSALSGAAPLFLSQRALADSTSVVTASNPSGWAFTTTGDATGKYSTGPAVQTVGNGSYELKSDSGQKGYLYDSSYDAANLTSLQDISYSYYVASRSSGTTVAPSLSLITTINKTWTELKAEPTYTNGAPAGSWQTIDAFAPTTKWYSTHDLKDNNGNTVVHKFSGVADLVSWDKLVSLDHSAKLGTDDGANGVRFTIGQNNGGAPWTGFDGYVDNVSIHTNTFNFEAAPSLGAENFNTVSDSSYKGISVGFNAKDFSGVSAVTVALKRTDGTTATMHGTQDLFDLIDANTAPYQFTAPFVIQAGSYSGDNYWTSDPATWNTKTVPESVTITVTGTNGTQSVTNSSFSQGAPSWPEYSSLVPPEAPVDAHFVTDRLSTLDCGSTVNSIYNNKLQLAWSAGSSNSASYRTLITYPDGGTKWAYTNSRNVWIGNRTAEGYNNNEFGEHGNGIYSYAVQARNANNQWSDSSTCTLAYDTHIPTAHLVSAPDDGAHVNGTLTIQASGEDNVALKSLFVDVRTQNGKTWEAGCTGTPVFTDSKNATLTCSINTSKLVDGTTYMLRAHAGDFAGYGNVNADAVRYITIDRTAPSAPTLTTPDDGTFTKDTTPTFTWNGASDTFRYQIQVSANSDLRQDGAFKDLVEQINPSADNYTFQAPLFSNLTDGTYYWHVRARDTAGNWSVYSPLQSFTVDTTAPVVSIDSPTAGDVLSHAKDGTVEIHGTVTDANADHYYLKITGPNGYNAGPHTVNSTTPFTNKNLYGWNLDGLASGDYVIDLEAADAAGNKDSGSVKKLHVTVDNTGPSSTNDLPSLVSGTVTVHQTVTDNNTPASGKLRIWKLDSTNKPDNSKFHASSQMAVDQNGVVTYVLDSTQDLFGDGDYIAKFTSFDAAGNGTVQQTYFTVDNTAPNKPVAAPGAGTYQGTQLVSLSSDDTTGKPAAAIYYTTDGSTPSSTNGKLFDVVSFAVSSDETVKAIAYDAAGNASDVLTAAYTITAPAGPIDNSSPQIPTQTFGNNVSVTFTNSTVQLARTGGVTVAGGRGGGDAQTGNADNADSAVLGASTTDPNTTSPSGHVKGDSTVNVQNTADAKPGNFLVLGWWWLLVVAAIIALLYLAINRDSRSKDAS